MMAGRVLEEQRLQAVFVIKFLSQGFVRTTALAVG